MLTYVIAIGNQPPQADAELIKKELDDLDNQPLASVPHVKEEDLLPLYANGQVPRIKYASLDLIKYLQTEVQHSRSLSLSLPPEECTYVGFKLPVVMTDGKLCGDAPNKWTYEYLEQHMGDNAKFSVFCSKTNK